MVAGPKERWVEVEDGVEDGVEAVVTVVIAVVAGEARAVAVEPTAKRRV